MVCSKESKREWLNLSRYNQIILACLFWKFRRQSYQIVCVVFNRILLKKAIKEMLMQQNNPIWKSRIFWLMDRKNYDSRYDLGSSIPIPQKLIKKIFKSCFVFICHYLGSFLASVYVSKRNTSFYFAISCPNLWHKVCFENACRNNLVVTAQVEPLSFTLFTPDGLFWLNLYVIPLLLPLFPMIYGMH